MSFKVLTSATAAAAAFVLVTSLAAANPSSSTVSTQTCPNTATTTNGTASSKSGVIEGAIPTTNTTKSTNSTQNGSPLEPSVVNPNNVSELPCAEGLPNGGGTAVHVNRLAGRNMLTHNPNGSSWLSKYNRSMRVSRAGNPPQ